MVPANALQRTFRLKLGDSAGTAFTIDVDQKQYLVTARHVVPGFGPSGQIEIFYKGSWRAISAQLVGHATGDVDVSVFALPMQLSPTLPLPPSSEGIFFGQDVYFLGYPYNLFTDIGPTNRDFPLPFIKKAIVSSISKVNDAEVTFLDGHNNPGFSGGPVVFAPPGKRDFRVAAVISGYRFEHEPVYMGGQPTTLAYRYNTGIIVSYGVQHAVDLARANPVGYALPAA